MRAKNCQGFTVTSNNPYAHKVKTDTTAMIKIPPPNGVPAFQLLYLSKVGVGLSNISTVFCLWRRNFMRYKKSIKGTKRTPVIKRDRRIKPSNCAILILYYLRMLYTTNLTCPLGVIGLVCRPEFSLFKSF